MARKTTAVAKTEDKGLPAYLKDYQGGVGSDNFDQSDIILPRLKLLQALSNECDAFDDAKAGRFWHTGFDVSLGEEITFVVASRKKKYLLVAPLEDGQGVLARAEDFHTWDKMGEWEIQIKDVGKVTWTIDDLDVKASKLDQWGTFNPRNQDSPPAATLFYEYLILLPDYPDYSPVVMSLTRSAIRKAKKGLNDKIALHGRAGRPMQSLMFKATSVPDTNSENQNFKNWQFTGEGFASEDIFNKAMELKDALTEYRVEGEEDAVNEERKSSNAESDDF